MKPVDRLPTGGGVDPPNDSNAAEKGSPFACALYPDLIAKADVLRPDASSATAQLEREAQRGSVLQLA